MLAKKLFFKRKDLNFIFESVAYLENRVKKSFKRSHFSKQEKKEKFGKTIVPDGPVGSADVRLI